MTSDDHSEDVDPEEVEEILDEIPLDFGDDLPPGREPKGFIEEMEEYASRDRDERILDKVSPQDHLGDWDPAEDDQLQRFIALREAGLARDIDITDDYHTWFELTERVDCRSLGYKLQLKPEDYFDGPRSDHDDIVDLNRTEDWERLKELAEFDPDEWPMEEIGKLVEEVHTGHA